MSNPLTRLLFETPIGPRHMTLAEIFGRKAAKKGIQELVNEQPDDQKAAEYNPVLGRLAFLNKLAELYALEKEAPFKSEAQRRKFYAMKSRGEISGAEVAKWEAETPDKKLPERLHKKEGGALLGKLPWLTMAPGKGLAMRAARGLGWAATLAGPVVSGAEQIPPSSMKLTADRMIASLQKEADRKGWLGRSSTGTPKLVAGEGPEGKRMAGPSTEEQVPSAGHEPHVQRGA